MSGIVVIGDVHGESEKLGKLLDRIGDSAEHVVLVGDYVNHGPDSRGVLELLSQRSAQEPRRYTFLAGNHDLAFLEYLQSGEFAPFALTGGLSTLRSYLGDVRGDVHAKLLDTIPPHHEAFLRALRPCWESRGILISHMGYSPQDPLNRSMEVMACAAHPTIFTTDSLPTDLVVCGHYHQRGGLPFRGRGLICVDTGAGLPEGTLTAIVLPSREIFQA